MYFIYYDMFFHCILGTRKIINVEKLIILPEDCLFFNIKLILVNFCFKQLQQFPNGILFRISAS